MSAEKGVEAIPESALLYHGARVRVMQIESASGEPWLIVSKMSSGGLLTLKRPSAVRQCIETLNTLSRLRSESPYTDWLPLVKPVEDYVLAAAGVSTED